MAETQHLLDEDWALSPNSSLNGDARHIHAGQAMVNVMLAIGYQCRGRDASDAYNATRLFTSGQKIAFQDYLCNPSLDMVRIFLLLSLYMLGACHRNAACK